MKNNNFNFNVYSTFFFSQFFRIVCEIKKKTTETFKGLIKAYTNNILFRNMIFR